MQIQKQKKVNNKSKKSIVLLIGSLLAFVGFCVLTKDYFIRLRNEVFMNMEIEFSQDNLEQIEEETDAVPIVENLPAESNEQEIKPIIDYSKYLGVLEIPKIGLKRGFYNIDSEYNSIEYNVSMVKGSTLPDVTYGNLILMAHSGSAAISYFAYLHNLKIGDDAYVTYGGKQYNYRLINVYDVEKTGKVKIVRSYNKTTLTLITCTKNNDLSQTVYIFELL